MADILQITLPDGTTYDLKDSTAVTDVSWDSTNWKIQKTINGNTSDVIAIPIINGAGIHSAKMHGCSASGEHAFAIGSGAQASGETSVAFVSGLASESSAVAIGSTISNKKTTASGICSIAIGGAATASGLYAVALGYKPVASASSAIAIGAESAANANYSLAFGGRGTKASSQYQTAMGKWNIEDDQDTYAFILGNGTADDARSNALTIDWSGNQTLAGSITLGYGGNDVTTLTAAQLKTLISTGTTGQVLTKTASGFEWASLPNANGVSF